MSAGNTTEAMIKQTMWPQPDSLNCFMSVIQMFYGPTFIPTQWKNTLHYWVFRQFAIVMSGEGEGREEEGRKRGGVRRGGVGLKDKQTHQSNRVTSLATVPLFWTPFRNSALRSMWQWLISSNSVSIVMVRIALDTHTGHLFSSVLLVR